MTTTFKGRVRNGKIEPLEPLGFVEGLDVVVTVTPNATADIQQPLPADVAELIEWSSVPESEGGPTLTEVLEAIAGLPEDGASGEEDKNVAVNHDHYLYGAPKRV